MLALPGYSECQIIHEGQQTTIVEARGPGGEVVMIKLLRDELADPSTIARLHHESELARRLQVTGILEVGPPRPIGNRMGIELEHLGAISLLQAISERSPGFDDLETALEIAARIAGILDELHREHVIHKNINPANLLFAEQTGEVRLIDFGIATELVSESADLAGGSGQGTPEYMSPEQTGRMNRSVDHRSDLYSFGATLYHLFTGAAPFDDPRDPLDRIGLVHAHIARKPIAPIVRNPALPQAVSDIVARLLEKDVERRYQSAFGLRQDLEHCLAEWRATGRIEAFQLGRNDLPARLVLSEQLFGRHAETAMLMDGFESAMSGKTELVLVSGLAGIGKSRLMGELQRPVAVRRGNFVTGKIDQYLADQPYGPFVQAFRSLLRGILAESETQLASWRQKLSDALGPNAQLVVDLVPELGLLLGSQPAPPALGATEQQNRFLRTLVRFVGALASAETPLVLILDDLQWSDGPTLDLLGAITRDSELGHLLIVAAYRDSEVDAAHPFAVLLDELAKGGFEAARIELGPLGEEHVAELVAAALREPETEILELVRMTHAKTAGNPFFVNEFLTALNEDELLVFDRASSRWRWAIADIEARDYTQNVVDLVTNRVERLPAAGRELLTLAACVGSEIDLSVLAELRGTTRAEVAEQLWPVLRLSLLIPVSASYLLERHEQQDEAWSGESSTLYRFMHDRVQQAAYALLEEPARREIHLQVGRLMKRRGQLAGADLFDLVAHLNLALPLIEEPLERRELAGFNLSAGRQARSAGAFGPALELLDNGLGLLAEPSWVDDYEFALELHLAAAEAAYLNHRFDRMTELANLVLEHSRALSDQVRIREIEIRALIAQERRLDALAIALPLLDKLDARIPGEPEPADYGAGFGAAEAALAGRSIESLAALPDMTDANALAAMRILSLIFSVTYFAAPQLLPLVIAKMVELSATHGNTPESAFGYTLFALHLCAFADQIDRGNEFARLSRTILERPDAKQLRARTLFIQNICVTHWNEPVHNTLAPLLEAYQSGLDTGDFEYSTHALMIRNQHLLAIGNDLEDLHARMCGQRAAIVASKEDAAISLFSIYQQVVANWLGQSDDPVVLTGEHHDEARMLEQHGKTGDGTSLFHIYYNKMVLAYQLGRFEQARALVDDVHTHFGAAVGVHQIPQFHFYESLILLSAPHPTDVAERERMFATIQENQGKLAHWAEHCPENNQHRWHLVEAELAVHAGDLAQALDQFERATELARAGGYPQEAALANERQALFWIDQRKPDIARLYLNKARHGFELWRARVKVEALDRQHAEILRSDESDAESGPSMDIESVLKAGEALSGITALDELMANMMQIMIENAGARHGVLFLPHKDRLVAAAEATADGEFVSMRSATNVHDVDDDDGDSETPFCAAVIRYVHRSGESVVLDDALQDERFLANPYLKRAGIRSLLCMPLLHKSKLAAVVYLENDLALGAFTSERLELLRLLSGQMAVSVENARIYDDLIALNTAYERFVPRQFLSHLGRDEITEVSLGDQVATNMTVMFVDIRGFTRLSERLPSADIFALLNGFLGRVEPVLYANGGFVDKYTGDGLMALFPRSAEGAVLGAVEVLRTIDAYNAERHARGREPLEIGIGIDSGELMLGTVGSAQRMDGTVISKVVNLASRIESLNKTYASRLLISDATLKRLPASSSHRTRDLGEVRAKGGILVEVHELYDADAPELAERKDRTRRALAEAAKARRAGNYQDALECLERISKTMPEDGTVAACLAETRIGRSRQDTNEESS